MGKEGCGGKRERVREGRKRKEEVLCCGGSERVS